MIDDKIEEGTDEETAVSEIGDTDEIIAQILADVPITKLVKERINPKRTLSVWEIIFLVLGSPIWLSLLIAAFVIFLSLYLSIWSVIISLWSVFVSLIGSAIGGIIESIVLSCTDNLLKGVAVIGISLVCFGLSIFVFYGCKAITKGLLWLTRKLVLSIKNSFIKKEAV